MFVLFTSVIFLSVLFDLYNLDTAAEKYKTVYTCSELFKYIKIMAHMLSKTFIFIKSSERTVKVADVNIWLLRNISSIETLFKQDDITTYH